MNHVTPPLGEKAIEVLFTQARTHHAWQRRSVDERLLQEIYALMKWGPTALNACPLRIVFVRSPEGKQRLIPCLHPENVVQTIEAPVTAILGYDLDFHARIPHLMPDKAEAAPLFADAGRPGMARDAALRNSSLQGAYLMLAARALGLDCGPMSAFDHDKLNAAFFPDGRIKVNFLCNLGYGDAAHLKPRGPRLAFDEACTLV